LARGTSGNHSPRRRKLSATAVKIWPRCTRKATIAGPPHLAGADTAREGALDAGAAGILRDEVLRVLTLPGLLQRQVRLLRPNRLVAE